MKFLPLYFLFIFATVQWSFAQTPLSQSKTGSSYSLVYKLTDAETYKIAGDKQLEIDDSFFHTVVDSFRNEIGRIKYKKLPYGNYLLVNAVESELHYQLYSVSNVNIEFLKGRNNFQFIVMDLKGNQIENAAAKIGNRKAVYNKRLHVYECRKQKESQVVTINYNNVRSFFRVYDWSRPTEKSSFFGRLFKSKTNKDDKSEEDSEQRYTGTFLTNKPVYRPLDTVKFKVFLLTKTGKAIKSKMLQVYVGNPITREILVASLVPYHDGGYEGSFVLNDSLKLNLDRTQKLTFKEQQNGQWKNVFSGFFRFEDYELKATQLALRMERQTYYPGMPVSLFVKATDQNGLSVPDGRIEVTVKSSATSHYAADHVFIKDTLYVTQTTLDPLGETKVVLPDDIFPGADVQAQVNVVFFNSNYERVAANNNFSYKILEEQLVASLDGDSVLLDFQVNGKSKSQHAKLSTLYERSKLMDSNDVILPVKVPIDGNVSRYSIQLAEGKVLESRLWDLDAAPKPTATATKDSLKIKVYNAVKLPFWYTVFADNKVIVQGYTNHLDTGFRFNSSKTADVVLNYNWAGSIGRRSYTANYDPYLLNVSLMAPSIVYPGETVDMEVNVADVNGKPVPQTDLTAYAHTSKFNDSNDPYFPMFSNFFVRPYKNEYSESVSLAGLKHLDWEKWSPLLGLDTLAFYRLLNAKELEVFKEVTKDTLAVMVPFAVKDGEIERVQIIYVDDVPVYLSQADQLKRYAFRLKPGNHQIKLRTTDHEIVYEGSFDPGVRTTIGIAATPGNTKAKVLEVPSFLTVEERDKLSKYMVQIYDNFGGMKTTLSDTGKTLLVNPPPNTYNRRNLLVGPLDSTLLVFKSGPIDQKFIKQDGYLYGFLPDSIIKQPFRPVVPLYFNIAKGLENRGYRQKPLSKNAIDSIWNDYLNLRSRNQMLVKNPPLTGLDYGMLHVEIDTSILNKLPYVKNVVVYTNADKDFRYINPGNYYAPDFKLKPGIYQLLYLLEDNRYFVLDGIEVKGQGLNYYHIRDAKIQDADMKSIKLDREIKSAADRTVESYKNSFMQPLSTPVISILDNNMRVIRMAGKIIDAATGEPMLGASLAVKVGNSFKVIGVVQREGEFDVMVPRKGNIMIAFVSYDTQIIKIRPSLNLLIKLKESKDNLFDNVVIRGYANTGAPGMRGSTNIRGLSTISATGSGNDMAGAPLILLDGKVFRGKITDLQQETLKSIDVLKDREAVRIYGTAGANGVILITSINPAGDATGISQEQPIRRNFSDYAIWQPKLITDQNGTARFRVKFPDDITNWTTRVLAINGHKQSGFAKTEIKSFKTLSANFSAPTFALKGDSINVIGKLMNYGIAEEQATRKFTYNGKELANSAVKFRNAHIDTLGIVANGMDTDSLDFKYTMEQTNGYFDGEIRKIPVLPTGVKETIGKFDALLSDTSVVYSFDPALGDVTIHAEKSVFPVLMDEIEKISSYEYLCNEQLASKLKALLLERQIDASLDQKFKEERQLKELVRKLQSAATTSNLWGWWQDNNPEYWISLHAIDALLKAGAAGYKINIDTAHVTNAILAGIAERKLADQFYALKILKLLKGNYNSAPDWIAFIEKEMRYKERNNKIVPLIEKLQLMEIRQSAGMAVDINWLLNLKKKTLLGNIYWGEPSSKFWDNSIQNSLLAYRILKAEGRHKKELNQIAMYFLEQRRDGQWRNTYESSLILETILPELLELGINTEQTSLVLNKSDKVDAFPLNKTIPAGKLIIDKKGKSPVYFTAYQQFLNSAPKKISQDFTVNTSFFQKGLEAKQLKAGVITTLKIEVEVKSEANYVMIEIPIPAGCSYYSKEQVYNGVEMHREYFKNKTSIFCANLKEGKHTFEVQLMPRYSGRYTVNPAKAELMYFPAFYGREELKKVTIN